MRMRITEGSGNQTSRPSTGSTGAIVSIFLVRDIARLESCMLSVEVIHSFRALTGRGHNVLRRERPADSAAYIVNSGFNFTPAYNSLCILILFMEHHSMQ